jgi:hypothetical protein
MSPIERLFMDAGLSYIHYQRWRLLSLPSMKTMAALERLHHGWPIESFDDEASELRLAKVWLESNTPRAAANRESKAVESPASQDPCYGPLMTTSEAKKLIQQEIEGGKPVTLKAFENALRRAAKNARDTPEELPLQLGGQHKDWQLVELGPESGGHGKGHRLRRRQPHTTGSDNSSL